MMIGKKECLQLLEKMTEEVPEEEPEHFESAVNRIIYEFAKLDGKKPKYHQMKRYNCYYTCGNCGFRMDVGLNFCPNCGFLINWDSIRCLTK